jgi:Adenylate and Guanylate cyclase catalytic domain
MIVPRRYTNWLLHRTGTTVDLSSLPRWVMDSLDHNAKGPDYLATFDKREFECFVGFVDLKGFSQFASGKKPKQISEYLLPFLTQMIDFMTQCECLIDKTIGDEIMFILPNPEEFSGYFAISDLLKLFRLLSTFSNDYPYYRYRIGLSYGTHYLDRISAKAYSEWIVAGEPIIAARRAMSLPELADPSPALCAVCHKSDLDGSGKRFVESVMKSFKNFPIANWREKSELSAAAVKGVGNIDYQVLGL